ncbi:hypothetical protein DRO44_04335 [Candidatus Bathyarchaeota archaeon]|nr:MAG: hypothetical protein DRO44_04335 [Candidatus Bathyarchaeota archaeon]
MCPRKKKTTKETENQSSELTTTQYLVETIKQLQTENENLKLELKKVRKIPSGKIGLTFIIPGALALIFSIINNSNILAFIGLGLTFWGALFFFVRPVRYVQSSLLDSTAISTYTTIDRIVKDLKFKGKSYYIPPYPKEVYLPRYLKGLKEPVVFISADTGGMPSIEELAKSKFILKNPNGICVAPPGLGLLTRFENELGKDLTRLQLDQLCEDLPPVILENLHLAKDVEMTIAEDSVYVKILDSTYKNLYTRGKNLKSIHFLGCPLVSSIACAIAKVTGKMVAIQEDRVSPDAMTIEVWYRLVEG